MTYLAAWFWQQPWRYRLNATRAFAKHYWKGAVIIILLLVGIYVGTYLLWEPVYSLTLSEQDKKDQLAVTGIAINKVSLPDWEVGYSDVKLEKAATRLYWLLTYRYEIRSGYVDQNNKPVVVRCTRIRGVLANKENGAFVRPLPFLLGLVPWWPKLAEHCMARTDIQHWLEIAKRYEHK